MTHTKIIATLGPATASCAKIEALIKNGVNFFRLNTKHSEIDWHEQKIKDIREASKKLKRPVGIFMVLRGPELRVGCFEEGHLPLKKGEIVYLQKKDTESDKKIICIPDIEHLDLKAGNTIYLDDGYIEIRVIRVYKDKAAAKVVQGGDLEDNKGINLPGVDVRLPSLAEGDKKFIKACGKDVDYFSYSFVRNKKDIFLLRRFLEKCDSDAGIISKIETAQAVENFEEILKYSDAIMIARGDLGIEIPLEEVPEFQKNSIKRCREAGKPVIIATQMLESMIVNLRPTRAEVSDVANAIYDGADSIMLSAETAIGKHPIKAVETMAKIARKYEKVRKIRSINPVINDGPEAIVLAAHKMLKSEYISKLDVKTFVVLTETGKTARLLARLRPDIPIIAVTDNRRTRNQMCLVSGIGSLYMRFPRGKINSTKQVLDYLRNNRILVGGDNIIITHGDTWRKAGRSNTIKILEI